MCAIAGILNLEVSPDTIQQMLETMARRGPDGRGVARGTDWTLLHSRLAIIDPEGGKQPMELAWAGEKYTIVYNGELYNTAELQQQLQSLGHEFSTRSDTEVILRGFAQWGEAVVEKLVPASKAALKELNMKALALGKNYK